MRRDTNQSRNARRQRPEWWLLIVAPMILASVGCRGHSHDVPEGPILFPVIPPIADADPSVREPVSVKVPTELVAERRGDSVTVRFVDLEEWTVTVGRSMATGVRTEERIHHQGGSFRLGGGLSGGFGLDSDGMTLTCGHHGIPAAGEEFVVEKTITLFETDVPPQHMWQPSGGRHYRVLWTRTFEAAVE